LLQWYPLFDRDVRKFQPRRSDRATRPIIFTGPENKRTKDLTTTGTDKM